MEVIPLPGTVQFSSMEEVAMARVGSQAYGVADLLYITLREFFGLPIKNKDGEVCSELCADLWVAAGVPLVETGVSPGRLRTDLSLMGIPPTFQIKAA
jgi:hypothetical protein